MDHLIVFMAPRDRKFWGLVQDLFSNQPFLAVGSSYLWLWDHALSRVVIYTITVVIRVVLRGNFKFSYGAVSLRARLLRNGNRDSSYFISSFRTALNPSKSPMNHKRFNDILTS